MKKIARISFFLFPFLITTSSKSQDYIPMALDSVRWIVAYDDNKTPWWVDGLWEYFSNGDTIIGGFEYRKIYTRSLVITQDPPPFEPNGSYVLKGFIRDDTIERQVLAIDLNSQTSDLCPENEEFLMYDFSLSIGDSTGMCLIPDFYNSVLDTIYDYTHLGFDTRYYSISVPEGYFEGQGSAFGLFEILFIPVDDDKNKYLGYTFLYKYCREVPCDLIVSVPEIQAEVSYIELNPNPTRDIINIRLSPKGHLGEIRILNAYGQLSGKLMTTPGIKHYQFDTSALTPGTYILVYTNGREVIARRKFVVMR